MQVGGFDLLDPLRKCNQLFTWNTIMKQIAFLIISYTPSMKNVAQISSYSTGQMSLFSPPSYIYLIVGIVGWLTNNVGRWIGSEIGSSS